MTRGDPIYPAARFPLPNAFQSIQHFGPSSPLHILLLPTRLLPEVNRNPVAEKLYEQYTTRLACLLYLHTTLWSYRNEPFRTDAYVANVASLVTQNNIDRSGSIEGLIWILIWACLNERDQGPNEGLARSRLVLRMMKVARKLSVDTWRQLERELFDALVGIRSRSDASDDAQDRPWIDAGLVWKEVLGDASAHVEPETAWKA